MVILFHYMRFFCNRQDSVDTRYFLCYYNIEIRTGGGRYGKRSKPGAFARNCGTPLREKYSEHRKRISRTEVGPAYALFDIQAKASSCRKSGVIPSLCAHWRGNPPFFRNLLMEHYNNYDPVD